MSMTISLALGSLGVVSQPDPPPPPAGGLSDDTSLSGFTIDGDAVTDGGTHNSPNGTTEVAVVAAVNQADATIAEPPGVTGFSFVAGVASWTQGGLSAGDNAMTPFTVTAQDGVTTHEYTQTLHILNAGVVEITSLDFTGLTGGNFATGSDALWLGFNESTVFWFDTGGEVQPDPGAPYSVFVRVPINPGDNDAAITTAALAAFASESLGDAGSTSTVAVVAYPSAGPRPDAVAGTSGAIVIVTQQGEDPS